MSFMIDEIFEDEWFEIETKSEGTCYFPMELFSLQDIENIIGNDILSFRVIHGFGARRTAPGYLDCTEWVVFETEKEAKEYLCEYFHDYDHEENEDEERENENNCEFCQ